jgi:hypothetical protein
MNIEFSVKIFEKYLNVKFQENTPKGSRFVLCGRKDEGMERRTDMTKLTVAFRNFAKAPENEAKVCP